MVNLTPPDVVSGGHRSDPIFEQLRWYLHFEWERLRSAETPNVPKQWQGPPPAFLKPQGGRSGAEAAAAAGSRVLSSLKMTKLPKQVRFVSLKLSLEYFRSERATLWTGEEASSLSLSQL